MFTKSNILFILRQNLNWVMLASFFFSLGIIFSTLPLKESFFIFELTASQQKILHEMAKVLLQGPPLRGILMLFMNNLFASLQMMLLGIFLGIPTLLGLFANGSLLGSIIISLSEKSIPPLTFIALGILPHGIFELPAFIISAAFGLKLGFHLVFPMPNKKRRQSLGYTWKEFWALLPLIISLLFIASIIEVLLTPFLVKNFIHF